MFWGIPLQISAEVQSCPIEAFVVQVPNPGCPMERYPVIFKPAQPHQTFAQSLRVELLFSKYSFEVTQGSPPYSFELKPGTYRFKITNTASPNCSTIQDLTVKRSAINTPLITVCKDINVQLQEGGVHLKPEDIVAESHSPCNPIKLELDKYFFSTADIGLNKVKVSLVDAQNRKQSCYSTVNVLPLTPAPLLSSIARFEQCAAPSSDIDNNISENGSITMVSKGRNASKFTNVLSQTRYGDGEIKVQLTSLKGEDQANGRAGLIITEACNSSSPFLSLSLEANTGTLHKEFRLTTRGEVVREWEHRLHPPNWLKLKRKGSHFKAFTSHNGLHWQLVYSTSMQVGTVLHWGIVTENTSSEGYTSATFNDLRISSEANMAYPLSDHQPNTVMENKTSLRDAYTTPKSKTTMEQEQWSIFPNPAQDYLEVTLPIWKDDRATLHLLNSAGKAVLEEHLDVLNGQSHWMNLARVARGVYYLKLQTIEGQHLTKKVIVDK